MLESGTILQERYRIDRQIGQGGMGAVYVATDERFGSNVAIKQTLCMDDNYRKAIEREARLLNSLKHIALPSVRDHFLENDGQFLVMEFIPGEDLCCILEDQGKPFEPDQVLEWADQLLDALEFLHSQEDPVIHRDIKPQNLKITPKGQIILLDFGLAKGSPTELNNKTAAKSIFGYSRNYASLEQIQGTGTDPRSDLYSLAATLYHLLTGTPPTDALTRAMDVLSQKPDPLIPAHLVQKEIPEGVSAILHSALDLNAAKRPASALEMRSMLAAHKNYAHMAARSAVASIAGSQIFSQPTKLMPSATAQGTQYRDEAATEAFDSDDSRITKLRKNIETEGDDQRPGKPSVRPFALAAGGTGAVLVSLAVAAGIFMYEVPRTAESNDTLGTLPPAPSALNTEVSANEPTAASAPASAPGEPNVPASSAPVSTERARVTATTDQNPTEKPTPEPEPLSPNARVIQTEEGPIIIDGNKIIFGDKKIIGNKVITPNGEFQLDRPVMPPPRPPRTGREPQQMRDLTPEQRMVLMRELRRIDANIRVRVPQKPKTPEPE